VPWCFTMSSRNVSTARSAHSIISCDYVSTFRHNHHL
jgi:hypothetical protein